MPGSSLFASEFLVLLGAFREFWLVGHARVDHDRARGDVHAPLDLGRPARHAGAAPRRRRRADAGGIRDLRWEAVWLVPLVAAVLALSAYPYFVTHRVDASVHALTAPAALEAGK